MNTGNIISYKSRNNVKKHTVIEANTQNCKWKEKILENVGWLQAGGHYSFHCGMLCVKGKENAPEYHNVIPLCYIILYIVFLLCSVVVVAHGGYYQNIVVM